MPPGKDSRANIELSKNGPRGWSAEDIYIRSHMLFSTLSCLPMDVQHSLLLCKKFPQGTRRYSFNVDVHACSVTSVMSDSFWPLGLQPARLLCPRDSPGMNTGWVAISSSRGSSWPRDQTRISCVSLYWQAGRFFLPPSHLGNPLMWTHEANIWIQPLIPI